MGRMFTDRGQVRYTDREGDWKENKFTGVDRDG